ncbi:hypothetical protein [Cytobacillus oceanisediminis]|nr:hypothetical protein [Cytobacillus oceanisediminis]
MSRRSNRNRQLLFLIRLTGALIEDAAAKFGGLFLKTKGAG